MVKASSAGRQRGHIRRRGNSLRVLMYAGVSPLTGRELPLAESTSDESEAKRILNRFRHRSTRSKTPDQGDARYGHRRGEVDEWQ